MPIEASGGRVLPRLAALAALVLVAACGTRPPAPIEHRPGGPGQVPIVRPGPAAPTQPAYPGTEGAEPEVQTVPVRPTSPLETRPLETRPSEARPQDGRPVDGRATTPGGVLKSQPRGTKLPYSPNAFAEIARADTAARSAEPRAADRPAGEQSATGTAAAAAAPVAGSAAASTAGAATGAPSPAAAAAGAESRAGEPPWIWPAAGTVVQGFDGGANKGIAITGKAGDPVVAAADGRVIFSGAVRGYGNLVILKHAGDVLSVYAHNRSLAVKEGQSVKRGQKIAEIGSTDADRVKLHFEIRRQGKPVDPVKLLPPR